MYDRRINSVNLSAWKDRLAAGKYDAPLAALYGAADAPRSRYARLCEEYLRTFGDAPDALLISAPGRTELAGNHTDHQLGIVLCAAVTLDAAAAAASAADNAVEIVSDGFGRVRVSLDDLAPRENETGTTAALIRGVAAGFAAGGLRIGGWRACIHSLVPAGGGLSSSAAFEILTGAIFSALYIDFAGGDRPDVTRIAFDFRAHGYILCAVNTHSRHDDLTPDYAAIPRDMTAVARAFGKDVLRQVDPAAFAAPEMRERLARDISPVAADRAEHFFAEDERVERMAAALQDGDMPEYIRNMNASGASSRTLLRNVVPALHPERTEMASALDRAAALLEGKGAWRIHGGGFAGCIQCLVPISGYEGFRAAMDGYYGEGACFELRIRGCGAYCIPEEE